MAISPFIESNERRLSKRAVRAELVTPSGAAQASNRQSFSL
jgi:hypothetical protein